jgi:hypothetical protein
MRQLAKSTLDRLKRTQNERKKYVPYCYVDEMTWTSVPVKKFEDRISTAERSNYIQILAWAKENCKGAYSRDHEFFWFKDGKDAFVFRLKWG